MNQGACSNTRPYAQRQTVAHQLHCREAPIIRRGLGCRTGHAPYCGKKPGGAPYGPADSAGAWCAPGAAAAPAGCQPGAPFAGYGAVPAPPPRASPPPPASPPLLPLVSMPLPDARRHSAPCGRPGVGALGAMRVSSLAAVGSEPAAAALVKPAGLCTRGAQRSAQRSRKQSM